MSQRSSSSRFGPADVGGKSADDSLLVIERARLALTSIGVPDTCFVPESYLSYGMNHKEFAKLLRAFPDFEEPGKVEELLLIGVRRNIFRGYRRLMPRVFYDFLQFLKGPEGQNEIAKLHLAEKLARRGGGHFDSKQVGLLLMFEAQRNDYVTEVNDVRREFDNKIVVELELQLRKLQAEREAVIRAVGKKYKPYSEMKFLADHQCNIACWDEYINACLVNRKKARNLESDSLDEAVRVYSDGVRQKNILKELDHGSRRKELEKWIAMKIRKFAEARDARQVKRFRNLLAAGDSTLLDVVPIGNEEEDYASDSSEQFEAPEHGGVFDQVFPGYVERGFGFEVLDGPARWSFRYVQQGIDEEQQPAAGGGVRRRGLSSRNPGRA